MKVTRTQALTYRLEAENALDAYFLGDLDLCRTVKATGTTTRASLGDGTYATLSMELSTVPADDLLQTLLKLDGLLRGQPHGQGHVGADAVDPHAQEHALTIIKKLNVVLDALGAPVGEAKSLQVVTKTHIASPGGENVIIGSAQRLPTDDTEGGAA